MNDNPTKSAASVLRSMLTAPEGKFRVIGLDLTQKDSGYFVYKDCPTLETAHSVANEQSAPKADLAIGAIFYVYNDKGCLC